MKELLISNQIVKFPSRCTHREMTESLEKMVSTSRQVKSTDGSDDRLLMDVIAQDEADSIDADLLMSLEDAIDQLSNIEKYALIGVAEGYELKEMAKKSGYKRPRLSMALKRAREKVKKLMAEEEVTDIVSRDYNIG